MSVYPLGEETLRGQFGVRDLMQGAQELARKLGYSSGTEVVIQGYRVTGANPLRFTRDISILVR